MMRYVGCCSRRVTWQEYTRLFNAIEVDSTFYRLPRVDTAKRWFESTSGKVRFCIKAFQCITHPLTSPTWKRAGSQMPKINQERYGHLKPTEENFEYWNSTLAVCKAVNAKICLLQLPPSFECNDEYVNNAIAFLSSIRRDGISIGIELRNRSWMAEENRGKLLSILDRDVVHVTDPFTWIPLVVGNIAYLRMHGKLSIRGNTIRYDYSHMYSDYELVRLKNIVDALSADEIYIMFNNINMHEDALRFRSLLS
ncbi:hypothetical protein HRbin04_00135 [archaeon HR04]|nr:hypothetical protein HRbin04_00135 [archaeon HR04]